MGLWGIQIVFFLFCARESRAKEAKVYVFISILIYADHTRIRAWGGEGER